MGGLAPSPGTTTMVSRVNTLANKPSKTKVGDSHKTRLGANPRKANTNTIYQIPHTTDKKNPVPDKTNPTPPVTGTVTATTGPSSTSGVGLNEYLPDVDTPSICCTAAVLIAISTGPSLTTHVATCKLKDNQQPTANTYTQTRRTPPRSLPLSLQRDRLSLR